MSCADCSCWKISDFSYKELHEKWTTLIGGSITPGYRKRFAKEGKHLGIPTEEVVLPFKYCLKGKLSRFYVVKHPSDTKPCRKVTECPGFTTAVLGITELPIPSPFWSRCTREAHGATKVRRQLFYPGLTELGCYVRIPAQGSIRPVFIHDRTCDICGNAFSRGIEIREITRFCCNKHYLQWWKDRNPEIYDKLNRRK